MQPFQVPRPNTIPGGARPGPPGRIPGPQPGARPGVPRPGMPGPMGVKPQIPSNIGVNPTVTSQIPHEEKPKEPVETIQQEPVQEEIPEQKTEPIKTEPPIKQNRPGPPQFGQKPMPKPGMPGMKPGPPFGQPQPMMKQPEPVVKQPEIPTKQAEPEPVSQRKPSLKPEIEPPMQRPPVQQEVEHREQIPQRKPSYKQEVVEQPIPQRKPSFQPEPQGRNEPPIAESNQAGGGDYSNDRLMRLSESLQAMKDLRSNFQGFNQDEQEEQEEEQYGEEEYAEEDDYVRVEDEEGNGDTANEGQRYSDENQEEELEDNQNQDYQEEDYEPEDQGNSEPQIDEPQYPSAPQIIEEEETPEQTPKAHIEASPERKLPPPMVKNLPPTGAVGMRPSPHGSAGLRPPGSAGIQPVGSAGIKPQSAGIQPGLIPKAQTSAGGMSSPFREEKNIIHHQPQHRSKYATESQELLTSHEGIGHESGKKDSDYERIEHDAAVAGGRSDPNLILKLERLELELEKEKKKSALLEEQQERVLNENLSLKQKNQELTARLELANKRTATAGSEHASSHHESDALKEELTRSLEETRQISENAQRMMQEASQYREETESFISTLEAEKNDLYQQVVQLKRQIDEDYVHQIESYKQRTDLLERKIKEHENNFNMVTVQLREKSSTIQKITSLNTEIQSALSTLHNEPFSSDLLQSRDFNLLPHDFTTRSNQKSLDFPRPQPAEVIHQEEPKPTVSSGKKPTPQEETVSGEALMAPPQSRLPNKAKKEEQPKPQAVPFKSPPKIQTQAKQPENISIIQYEENKPSPSKIVAGKSKLHAKTNKNPFADEEEPLESPNPIDESAVNYDQQFIEEPAQQYYAEEQGYTEGQDEPLDEIAEAQDFFNDLSQQAQKEVHSGGLLNTSKQSKSSLRYSANEPTGENRENQQGGALTQEAAENFFDQLGNNPNPESPNETPAKLRQDPYQYNQPKPQVQAKPVHKGTNPFADEPQEEAPPVSQPQKQVHQQVPPKKVVQSSIQKGKNPFADEQEDSSQQFQAPPKQVPQQTTKQLPPPRTIVPTSSHKGTNPFAEENEAEIQPPVQAKTVVRQTPQRGKNPFDDEGETQAQGSDFFQQQQQQQQQTPQPQAQPRTQVPPQNIPQNRAQPFPKPGQPKAAIKRGNNPFADEEEEKNVQPQIQSQPPVQKFQQPPVQTKPVSRGPIQKGNNPFAEENEGQNPFDEAGSFVDRPEVQRPNQPKTLPLQTGVAKKLDVQPSKGSALKKAKGVIPSNMFD